MKILDCEGERLEMTSFAVIDRLPGEVGFQKKFVNREKTKLCRFINVSKKWIELVTIH